MCSSCPALALLPAVVLLQWTKACPEAFLPHLEALATQVRELWDAGRIRAGLWICSSFYCVQSCVLATEVRELWDAGRIRAGAVLHSIFLKCTLLAFAMRRLWDAGRIRAGAPGWIHPLLVVDEGWKLYLCRALHDCPRSHSPALHILIPGLLTKAGVPVWTLGVQARRTRCRKP